VAGIVDLPIAMSGYPTFLFTPESLADPSLRMGTKRISTRLSRAAAMRFIIDSECPS
jgi:hypothetical protein